MDPNENRGKMTRTMLKQPLLTHKEEVTKKQSELRVNVKNDKVRQRDVLRSDEVALDRKRASIQEAYEDLKKRSLLIVEKEEKLQAYFIRYNSFLKNNKAKRDRLQGNTEFFLREQAVKTAELQKMRDDIDRLKNYLSKYQEETKKLSIYYDFLVNLARQQSHEFPDVSSILNRFVKLNDIQRESHKRFTDQSNALLKMRQDMSDIISKCEEVRATLMLELIDNMKIYQEVYLETQDVESGILDVTREVVQRTVEYVQCVETINNVYESLKNRSEEDLPKGTDIAKQTRFIKIALKTLMQAVKFLTEETEKTEETEE